MSFSNSRNRLKSRTASPSDSLPSDLDFSLLRLAAIGGFSRSSKRRTAADIAERNPSGHLFAEGCDRPVVVLVHPEYCVQICASKQILDALRGRDQLEFATAVPRRDQESN